MRIDAANHRPTITPITFDQSRPPNLFHCPTNRRSPFFKLKWIRWGWGTGTATVILGMLLCAVFVGCLSYLAPTGRVTVISRVVEVTANVSGPDCDLPASQGRATPKVKPHKKPTSAKTTLPRGKLCPPAVLASLQVLDLSTTVTGRASDV
jgi:hypothetical protein